MRFKNLFSLLTIVVIVLFGVGCTSSISGSSMKGSQLEFRQAVLSEELSRVDDELYGDKGQSLGRYYFLMGELALHNERFEDALGFFEKAATLDETASSELRKRLAELYIRGGDLDVALEQINLALEGSPEDESLLRLRAGVYSSIPDVPRAVQSYTELIQIAPKEQDYYILLSSLHAQVGDFDSAIDILKSLNQQVPDSLFGHYYLARVFETAGRIDEARDYYRKAISLSPNAEAIQLDFARAQALHGHTDEAIALLRKILKTNPRSVKARKLLGQFFWEGKKHDKALVELEKLREIEDDPTETRVKIGLIKLEQRDFQGAVEELLLVLAAKPSYASARYFLGTAYSGLGRSNDAISELFKIKQGDKMFTESRTLAAYILRQEKRLDEAADVILELLNEKDDNIPLMLYLATLYREGKRFEKAIAMMQSVVELEPNNDGHLFTLGVLYDESKDRPMALKYMRQAIELNPNNANALNYLGYSLAVAESPSLTEAEALVKRALEIEPNNGYFIDSLGWIYFKMGRYKDARRELLRAVDLVPNDAVILEHLAEAQLGLNEESNALATFRKALVYAPDSDDESVEERVQVQIKELELKLGVKSNVGPFPLPRLNWK